MRRDSLGALGELRSHRVDECTAKLTAATRALEEASRGREAEERAWQRERALHLEVDNLEQGRLDSGNAKASDLARAAEFDAGAQSREHEIERRLRAAEERERTARRAHFGATRELAEAEAERLAFERYRERRRATEAKRAEQLADEELMDGHHVLRRKVDR